MLHPILLSFAPAISLPYASRSAAITALAHAATINVSPGQSIQSAISAANNGDTVLVATAPLPSLPLP